MARRRLLYVWCIVATFLDAIALIVIPISTVF